MKPTRQPVKPIRHPVIDLATAFVRANWAMMIELSLGVSEQPAKYRGTLVEVLAAQVWHGISDGVIKGHQDLGDFVGVVLFIIMKENPDREFVYSVAKDVNELFRQWHVMERQPRGWITMPSQTAELVH